MPFKQRRDIVGITIETNRNCDSRMSQINVTLPDKILEMLGKMAESTGLSKSGLASEYIRQGLYRDVEAQERMQKFMKD